MKRNFILFLFLLVPFFAFSASFNISGPSVVEGGSEVEYKVTLTGTSAQRVLVSITPAGGVVIGMPASSLWLTGSTYIVKIKWDNIDTEKAYLAFNAPDYYTSQVKYVTIKKQM